jgi:hypothetical protein
MAQLGVERANDERNLPVVTIDVPRKSLDALDGLEPGQAVRVVLEGTVQEVSRKEPDVSYPGFSGMLRVEVKRITARSVDNVFAELVEDDE